MFAARGSNGDLSVENVFTSTERTIQLNITKPKRQKITHHISACDSQAPIGPRRHHEGANSTSRERCCNIGPFGVDNVYRCYPEQPTRFLSAFHTSSFLSSFLTVIVLSGSDTCALCRSSTQSGALQPSHRAHHLKLILSLYTVLRLERNSILHAQRDHVQPLNATVGS